MFWLEPNSCLAGWAIFYIFYKSLLLFCFWIKETGHVATDMGAKTGVLRRLSSSSFSNPSNRINRAVSFQLLRVSEFPRSWSRRNPYYSHLFTHGAVSFPFLQGCFAGWNFSGCKTRRQVRSDEGAGSSKPTRVFGELLDVWWENKLPKLHL